MVISAKRKSESIKDIYAENIVESLGKAISDFAKERKTTPSSAKSKAKATPFNNRESLLQKKIEVKKVKKISKNKNKISGFYGKKKAASPRKVKSRYFNGATLSPGIFNKPYNFYQVYKKSLGSGVLAMMMLFFVSATTYVAYAYMTSANADLVNNIGKHLILPVGETPKVYIIQSEKADLFNNPAFSGIKVGDNVLTYTTSGKVVIYRSTEDKIVNIVNLK